MRVAAVLLRIFAFGLIAAIALAWLYSAPIRERLADAPWLASLVPHDAVSLSLWLLAAAFNAGAAFFLAAWLESRED